MNDAKLRMLNGRGPSRAHKLPVVRVYNGEFVCGLFGALFPGMDKGFGFDAEGIGDAIDVIKIANYLGGIVNPAIIEAMGTQHIEVGRAHLLGGFGEFLGVGTERHIGR